MQLQKGDLAVKLCATWHALQCGQPGRLGVELPHPLQQAELHGRCRLQPWRRLTALHAMQQACCRRAWCIMKLPHGLAWGNEAKSTFKATLSIRILLQHEKHAHCSLTRPAGHTSKGMLQFPEKGLRLLLAHS